MSEEASARPQAPSELDTVASPIARRKRDLTVMGIAAVVLALSTLAAKTALTDTEVAVFRAINDLPQRLHTVVWPVMQYGTFITIPVLAAIAPAVLVIVAQAVVRVGGRALRHPALVALAVAAFVALSIFKTHTVTMSFTDATS